MSTRRTVVDTYCLHDIGRKAYDALRALKACYPAVEPTDEDKIMKKIAIAAVAFATCLASDISCANNLSQVYAYSVESAQGGTEILSRGVSSTSRSHGGAWMRITTEEIGYGSNARATLLGFSLREIQTVPLCNLRGSARPCNGRGTIVGYRRTWDASGRDGGNFEYMVIPNGVGGVRRVNLTIR